MIAEVNQPLQEELVNSCSASPVRHGEERHVLSKLDSNEFSSIRYVL